MSAAVTLGGFKGGRSPSFAGGARQRPQSGGTIFVHPDVACPCMLQFLNGVTAPVTGGVTRGVTGGVTGSVTCFGDFVT
jgi:hypothetical protein